MMIAKQKHSNNTRVDVCCCSSSSLLSASWIQLNTVSLNYVKNIKFITSKSHRIVSLLLAHQTFMAGLLSWTGVALFHSGTWPPFTFGRSVSGGFLVICNQPAERETIGRTHRRFIRQPSKWPTFCGRKFPWKIPSHYGPEDQFLPHLLYTLYSSHC